VVEGAAESRSDTILGLDEAGRGSLLGPLVLGGFEVPRHRVAELRGLGAADSKSLRPAEREAVYQRLGRVGRRVSVPLPPRRIDAAVAVRGLNRLEAAGFAGLVRAVRPTEAVVDACDPVAARFGALVADLSRTSVPVRAFHHADVTDPVVGAASIVAKVRRDRAIRGLARRLGRPTGSGYPSDPTTVALARQVVGAGAPYPPWFRRSWATAQRLMRERSARRLEEFP
jgi:ribonuclease HII